MASPKTIQSVRLVRYAVQRVTVYVSYSDGSYCESSRMGLAAAKRLQASIRKSTTTPSA